MRPEDIEQELGVTAKKKKRFRLFDMTRDGKGITKEQAKKLKPNLRGFFSFLRRDFGRIITVNMFLVIGNFPLLFALLAFSGVGMSTYSAPVSSLLATLQGVISAEGMSAAGASLLGIGGMHATLYAPTVTTYVLYALSALVIFTFGFVSVGTTYIMRNMLMGEPTFLWSDFWYAVRRNLRQGLIMGILDVLCLFLLVADIMILFSGGSSLGGVLVGVIFVFFILYLFMRPYLYLQIVTFDLSIFKIFKNALIFALLGLKRNLTALLGIVFMIVLIFFMIFGLYGILIPIGLATAVAFLPGLTGYISVFAAFFKLKEIMIDPQMKDDDSLDEITPIAIDRG